MVAFVLCGIAPWIRYEIILLLCQKATNCMQAEDDPIAPKDAIPFDKLSNNPNCTVVLTPPGGHLGWCNGGVEGVFGGPWTDKAVIEYLQAVQKLKKTKELDVVETSGVYTSGYTTHQAP